MYRVDGQNTDSKTKMKYMDYEKMQELANDSSSVEISTTINSFDNFFFIGDFRYNAIKDNLKELGKDINVLTDNKAMPSSYKNITYTDEQKWVVDTGDPYNNYYLYGANVPNPGNVNGISIMLGFNNLDQAKEYKEFLDRLLLIYPNTPIFVNSVLHVGKDYGTEEEVKEINAKIDAFNKEMSEYCGDTAFLYYISTIGTWGTDDHMYTEDSNELSNQKLRNDYTDNSDNVEIKGLYLNNAGNAHFLNNLKNGIGGDSATTGTTTNVKRENIREYYSIDDEGKLVIAGQTTTQITGTNNITNTEITLKHIDYEQAVEQYTTYWQFLLYLALNVQNPEFMEAVTDMILDSQIDFVVMDTTTTTTETELYQYVENTETMVETESETTQASGDTLTITKTELEKNQERKMNSTTTTTTTIAPIIQITYAKTWFSEQTISYKKAPETSTSESYFYNWENDSDLADDYHSSPTSVGQSTTWVSGRARNITITTTTNTYKEDVRGEVQDKTGEVGSGSDSFIGLLDVKFKKPNSNAKITAGENIESGAELLFLQCEQHSELQTMEQLMRYILYKYTGTDYGVIEFDFNVFDAKDFRTIMGLVGSTVEDKFFYALMGQGYSLEAIAGAMGNIKAESGFSTTIRNPDSGAFGLAQWIDPRLSQLKAYATSKGTTVYDEDTQIEFLITEITGQGDAVGYTSRRGSGGYSGGTCVSSYGSWTFTSKHDYDWANATTVEDATFCFGQFFESPSKDEMRTSINDRIAYALEYYEMYKTRTGRGEFNAQYGDNRIKGYYTSYKTGRTFTIFNQGSCGWPGKCNRAASAIIASGYSDQSIGEAISYMNNHYDGSYYGAIPSTSSYWQNYGLKVSDWMQPGYNYQDKLQNQLTSGGYALLWLNHNSSTYRGKSGTVWTSLYHWVAVIDYAYEEDGFKICIADWRGITWVDISEFSTWGVTYMVFVNEQ